MGVASWMVWQKAGGAVPLSLYAVQLALNLAWTPLFFKKHQLTYALADITGRITPLLNQKQLGFDTQHCLAADSFCYNRMALCCNRMALLCICELHCKVCTSRYGVKFVIICIVASV